MDTVIINNPRKRRCSAAVDEQVSLIIKNTYAYLIRVKQTLIATKRRDLINTFQLKNINKKVSELCEVARSTVKRKIKEDENKENLAPQPTLKSLKKYNSKYKCDEFAISMIRRLTQEFYANKSYPNVTLLWKSCLENKDFPQVSKSTFYNWLIKRCKFKYRRTNKKPVFLERADIVIQRRNYLLKIKEYRRTGYRIFYSDETWVSPDQSRHKCWHMYLTDTEKTELKDIWGGQLLHNMDGFAGGFLVKSANGRIILNHIGSEDGFLEGGEDLFISKKDTRDYHGTMNFERYITWFGKVLSLVPDKSVLVLDQAPYHKKRVFETIMPTMAMRKAEVISWLEQHHVELPDGVTSYASLTKPHLINLSKTKPVKTKYIVEDLAEKCAKDVKILWLPVAHCEFNPIELVWAYVKGYVAKHNDGKNLHAMLELTKEALALTSKDLWRNCVKHAIKYEDMMWNRDHIIDNTIEEAVCNLIIPVRSNDTSSEDDTSDSDSSQSGILDSDAD